MTDDTNPITIGTTEIQDAHVNWNLGCASPPELYALLDGELDIIETVTPVGTHDIEVSDPNAEYWLAYSDGIYKRFKDGKVGVPADEKPISTTVAVKSVEGTEQRVPDLHHTTERAVNEIDSGTAMSITFFLDGWSYPSSRAVDVGLGQALIDRYIHGPLGSDDVSNTFHTREEPGRPKWSNLQLWPDREDWQRLNDVAVCLADNDNTRPWVVRPQSDQKHADAPAEDARVYHELDEQTQPGRYK